MVRSMGDEDMEVLDVVKEQLTSEYHRRGFVVIRSFFERGMVEAAERESRELASDVRRVHLDNLRCRFMPHIANQELVFECFDPIVDISPAIRAISESRSLMRILESIYGEPACLFKDKLIYKPAGAVGYPLHQDYIAWPNFPRSFLSVAIPIDACTEANGCTVVYEGYHDQGLLTPDDGSFHTIPEGVVANGRRVALELRPGDIAIFSGLTPHESSPNASLESRRQIFLSFNCQSDGGVLREQHYQDFRKYMSSREKRNWYFF